MAPSKKLGWSRALVWALANLAVAIAALYLALDMKQPWFAVLILPFLTGGAQALAIRGGPTSSFRWFVWSAAGYGFALWAGGLAFFYLDIDWSPLLGIGLIAVLGAMPGLAQWRCLRGAARRAPAWPVVSGLIWAGMAALAKLGPVGEEGVLMAVFWFLHPVVLAPLIVWILRSPAVPAAESPSKN